MVGEKRQQVVDGLEDPLRVGGATAGGRIWSLVRRMTGSSRPREPVATNGKEQDWRRSSTELLEAHLEFPRTPRFGRDYWLTRCEGWRVGSPRGRIGRVETLRFETRHDLPDYLVVRVPFRWRRRLVPIEQVTGVDPMERRVRVAFPDGR